MHYNCECVAFVEKMQAIGVCVCLLMMMGTLVLTLHEVLRSHKAIKGSPCSTAAKLVVCIFDKGSESWLTVFLAAKQSADFVLALHKICFRNC